MKKLSFLAMTAVAFMFTACSDKDEVAQEAGNLYNMVEGESSWIAVGISTPGEAATRANEDIDDGVAAEYAVKDMKLVLFKGTTESDAVLVKDYDVTGFTFQNETGDQNLPGKTLGEVTQTSKRFVQEIQNPALLTGQKLFVYVILNAGDNATGIDYSPGQTFTEFSTQALQAIGIADEAKGWGALDEAKGIVMTNVPIADKPNTMTAAGEGTKVTTLAEVAATNIYNTREAAEKETNPVSACVYVERAAVKVQVTSLPTKVTVEGINDGIAITSIKWGLGNVNSKSTGYFNTRQFDVAWVPYMNAQTGENILKYRMVGRTNFFESGHTDAYRTYFGKDVNYDGREGLLGGQLADADYSMTGAGTVYTYENTFDENSQIYANTTYVGFKVTTGAGDFYTLESAPNTMLKADDNLERALVTNSMSQLAEYRTAIADWITAELKKSGDARTLSTTLKSVTFKLVADQITWGDPDDEGAVTCKFTVKIGELLDQDGNDITGADATAINAQANTILADVNETKVTVAEKVYKYTGGVMYYATRISHFGDDETPWDAHVLATGDYVKIYPTDGKQWAPTGADADATFIPKTYGASRAAAWLGRWGIVRNNWYKLSITAIDGLGSPVPEDFSDTAEGTPGSTPDDNPKPKYYIAAHVHIVPWVIRNQAVVVER